MARPKAMTPDESAALIKAAADKITYIEGSEPKAAAPRVAVVSFQVGIPSDLLGSRTTFGSNGGKSLEATALGIVMRNKGTRRKVMVPWGNIKAAEFAWDGE
jgi:hypothetical protein